MKTEKSLNDLLQSMASVPFQPNYIRKVPDIKIGKK